MNELQSYLPLIFSILLPMVIMITVLSSLIIIKHQKLSTQQLLIHERLRQLETQRDNIGTLLREQQKEQHEQRASFDQHQINSLKIIQDSLQKALSDIRAQMSSTLKEHTEYLGKRVDALTNETQARLKDISGQVDRRLAEGFEKTTATFTNVMERLATIDEAQKKITELSRNVVSLKDILVDKRSRGAFGEVQLSSLIRNMIPESHFSLQHTLSNKLRPDCVLFLPDPTGNVVVDAKFPLESYQKIVDDTLSEQEHTDAKKQFRMDIKHHIKSIADKYILPGETADGAIMFIPAESIFAEIHAHYPDLVETSQKMRVWLVSPTTMMAILTTARAVLKDEATREQVHIIQEHLGALGKDFTRFQQRMDKLAEHIRLAQNDVEQVHKSSQKISSRFQKIEKVELSQEKKTPVLNEQE